MRARIHGAPRLNRPLCAIVILLLSPVAVVHAQSAGTADPMPAAVVTRPVNPEAGQVDLLVGHSTVLDVGVPITRVSLTRPEIADAVATSSQQLLIHGKAPGSITMFVWDRAGGIKRYEVRVQRDLTELQRQMEQLFPGEPISVVANGSDVVISGTVSSKYIAEKAAGLRIFHDAEGKMNRNVAEAGGSVLVISAFTLQADARKGRRPSFDAAAGPDLALALYERLCQTLSSLGLTVAKGIFRAHMEVSSINDGPICVLLDSKRLF